MTENDVRLSLRDRIRWLLYKLCFAYCVRQVHPNADPSDFSLLDEVYFVALSRDEAREIVAEAPDVAWRFEGLLGA